MIRAVAAVAMATPAWPAFGVVGTGACWHAAPHLAVKLSLGLAAGCAAIALIAALAPVPLVVAAAGTALGLTMVEAWLGRSSRGVAAGLPPGSLRLLPRGPWRDQGYYAAQARSHGPVFKTRQIVRPLACIADLPAGRRMLKDEDEALVAPPLRFSRFIPGGYLRYRKPSEHAHYKSIFRAAFSRNVVAAHDQAFREGFRAGLAAAAAERAAGVPPRPCVNRILFPLWVNLFAGLEPGAPAALRVTELSRVIDPRNPSWASDRRVRAAVSELSGVMQTQRARFDALPPGEAPRCFLDEIRRHDAGALDDQAVLGNLVFLLHVTWSDMSGLLTWIVRMLADHPAVVLAARAESAKGGVARDGLCARIVLETLRLEQSEHIYRRTTRAVPIGDLVIPPGWIVRIGVHEAHRNAAVFERPDTFDPDRFLDRSYSKDEYSPFGAHRLACLGEQVTLAVARIFTEELTTGFDLHTTRDGPAELGSLGHWAPSRHCRLALTPAAGKATA